MKIDVYQDTVCPWCRIGKRHLKLALEGWQGEPVEVNYRSFFLNPDIPPQGHDFRTSMLAKGGGRIPLEGFFAAPRQKGAAVGLIFNFDKITRAPNTLLSHRLVALMPEEKKEAMLEVVYTAYFEHGQDIGDLEVLVNIAAEQGLDPGPIREKLHGEAGQEQVLAEARWAQEHGISGVPFFIINQRYAFSGAQPPELILQLLQQIADGTIEDASQS